MVSRPMTVSTAMRTTFHASRRNISLITFGLQVRAKSRLLYALGIRRVYQFVGLGFRIGWGELFLNQLRKAVCVDRKTKFIQPVVI